MNNLPNLQKEKSATLFNLFIERFLQHKLAVFSTGLLLCLVIITALAKAIAPYDPAYMDVSTFSDNPSEMHVLGTDKLGRDILSRLLYGGQISLTVGFVTVATYLSVGIIMGALAGYFGGSVDMIVSRVIDTFMSFPPMMIIIVLVSILGPGLKNIIIALSLVSWPQIARIVRGEFLHLKSMEYVISARMIGCKDRQIIFRHILPNAINPIIVAATFGIATAILYESGLSFLGLGVQPPISSWGQMLNDAQSMSVLENKPWVWVPPGLLILLTVLGINFVGDGLRDALDPNN